MNVFRWFLLIASLVVLSSSTAIAQDLTPGLSCATIGTPTADHGDHSKASHEHHGEHPTFDQLYIDMMVPHHEAVIALAEAALPTLTEPILIEMAEAIVTSQTSENTQLLEWREAWFGSDMPLMDETTMEQMLAAMPVGSMEDMMLQMDPAAQVAAFCSAPDPDRAFAEQTLAHHQMAVDASVIAIDMAEHPDLVAFAEQVIVDQQAEIDLLIDFLAHSSSTPVS